DDFAITIYDQNPVPKNQLPPDVAIAKTIADIYASDTIFYAVPISDFDAVITKHAPFITDNHTLIDVLSVKTHPAHIFKKHLVNVSPQIILTHPMFGPDSSGQGFSSLPITLDSFTASNKTYDFWKSYFAGKQLRVVEMTAEEHDKLAANSQGLAHFIG